MKPLFFDFLYIALSIDAQFLVGGALLICPQLVLGQSSLALSYICKYMILHLQ